MKLPAEVQLLGHLEEVAVLPVVCSRGRCSGLVIPRLKQGGNGPMDQRARLRDIDEVDYACFCDSLVSKWHTLQNVGNV